MKALGIGLEREIGRKKEERKEIPSKEERNGRIALKRNSTRLGGRMKAAVDKGRWGQVVDEGATSSEGNLRNVVFHQS